MWLKEGHPFRNIEKRLAAMATGESIDMMQMCVQMAREVDEGDYTFRDNSPTGWKCRNCGYIPSGSNAPEKCPVCSHPKAYFERIDKRI